MSAFRVVGILLASYVPYEETDRIDLDLIVSSRSAVEAEYRVLAIVAPDYDWRRWATRPVIEDLNGEANE